jgi:hypothetical protein
MSDEKCVDRVIEIFARLVNKARRLQEAS